MSHLRKQIRDRIIANVSNLTSTGSRVYQTRLYPVASVSLPTLLVYTVSETSEPETMSRPRKIIRRVDFALEGMVNGTSGLDDSLDAIAKDVEERKKSKQTAVETAVHDLQVAYPTAKVTASKDWTRGYGKSAYRDYDKITIQFTNGIQVAYEVYSDGRLNRLSVDFGKLEHHEVLNLLSEAQAPISE